jgi:hypothetical protein
MINDNEIKKSADLEITPLTNVHQNTTDLSCFFTHSCYHPYFVRSFNINYSPINNYPLSYLNREKTSFEFYSSNCSTEVGSYTHQYMSTDIFYPTESQIFQFMTAFQCTKEPFNSSSVLIDFTERLTRSYCFQYVLGRTILLEIKSGPINIFPTFTFKDTGTCFFFVQSTSEFDSLPLSFSSIVTGSDTCLTEEFSFWVDSDSSTMDGILSGSCWDNVK